MQKLIGISIFIAIFVVLLLAYLYFNQKPDSKKGDDDDGDNSDNEPPKLLSGKSYIIERNNQYLYFDSSVPFTNTGDNTIIKNVKFKEAPTTWTLSYQGNQSFFIYCTDAFGTQYYLFPYGDDFLGCVKVNQALNLPLINNKWYQNGGLLFNFELQNDKSYVIKYLNKKMYLGNESNIAKLVNPPTYRFKLTETTASVVTTPAGP